MNTLEELGPLALGSRLKRLGDTLMTEVEKIYAELDLDLKPSCFPLLWTLQARGPQSVTELARQLGISHPAVTQAVRELVSNGWVQEERDADDSRKRNLSVSEKTTRLLQFLNPLWDDIREEVTQRLSVIAPDLLPGLHSLEKSLSENPLAVAVGERRKTRSDSIRIVSWDPAYKAAFTALNKEWIQEYFTLEEKDIEVLEHPEQSILARGGDILFAIDGTQVIGTCVLVPHPEGSFELTKMAVAKAARGRRIGIRLCKAALERAKEKGARTVFLESHHSLRPALQMYEKLGFRYANPPQPSAYSRVDIYMYKSLA